MTSRDSTPPPDASRRDTNGGPVNAFTWKDHSRFVEVYGVATGWLVLWGRYRNVGREKVVMGNRCYTSLSGVRRRLVTSVLDLTRRPQLADEATFLFDQTSFPAAAPVTLPDPL